jgi:hypothetical protein
MVLAFDARPSTADVDVDVDPAEEVMAVARSIASRHGWPEQWLGDAAKGFIPAFKDPEWRPVFKVGRIEIVSADERTMLAMKMRASRGSRDVEESSSC